MKESVSYAIGCMMGRYSLDAPGLIYAQSGGAGFDASRYTTFSADSDGIVPLTDFEWFEDDAAHRLTDFISVAWDGRHLEENLAFLAGNLSPKRNESSRATLRRYLCDSFFKDHLKTYKKRPIYWLFSSGRQKAYQCLVYLHRYNEGTLAPDAYRVRDSPAGHDGFPHSPVGGGYGRRSCGGSAQAAGEGAVENSLNNNQSFESLMRSFAIMLTDGSVSIWTMG